CSATALTTSIEGLFARPSNGSNPVSSTVVEDTIRILARCPNASGPSPTRGDGPPSATDRDQLPVSFSRSAASASSEASVPPASVGAEEYEESATSPTGA